MNQNIVLSSIGTVRIDHNGFYLDLKSDYIPALVGLDDFSHVNVLWWAHLMDDEANRANLQVQKPYRNGPAVLGIYATRSPQRPNPIGLSVAPILQIDHSSGIIQLAYIDAENGTPLLDLKPYHPSGDRLRDPAVPVWCSTWPDCYEESADFDWESVFRNVG